MSNNKLHLIILFIISNLLPYKLPQDFNFLSRNEVLLDLGIGWDVNSFSDRKSLSISKKTNQWIEQYVHSNDRFNNKKGDSLSFNFINGLRFDQKSSLENSKALTFFIYSNIEYKKFYYDLYLRATSNPSIVEHFYGIERDISRLGLRAAEVDISSIGYDNGYARIEYGRGREIWGIGYIDNIILSSNTPSFERLLFQISDRNKFIYRYFYGYLESISDSYATNYNRYLSGKIIEYKDGKFMLSAGEISIMSGDTRPIDLSFLNPFSFHLEIEQNGRSNVESGLNGDNAIWFVSFDSFIWNQLRLSLSIIMDEFQLDSEDRDMGRPDALGINFHSAYTPRPSLPLTILFNFKSIGTYVYQHENWHTNFVNRFAMLGSANGNDMYSYEIGARYINKISIIEMKIISIAIGENSILDNPYKPFDEFIAQPFPSGEITKSEEILISFDSYLFDKFNILGEYRFGVMNKNNTLEIGLEYIF